MKRASLVAAAIVLAGSAALAHTNPARRSVALQIEKDSVVLLVQWTVPSGEYGDAYSANASWARSRGDARHALEASLAAKAIGPLMLTLDGAALSPEATVKLSDDPPRSGRLSAVVLLTAPIPAGEHSLGVSLKPGTPELTRFVLVDRAQGRATLEEAAPSLLDPARPVVVKYRR